MQSLKPCVSLWKSETGEDDHTIPANGGFGYGGIQAHNGAFNIAACPFLLSRLDCY